MNMAVSTFTRFTNLRHLINVNNINNVNTIGTTLSITQCLNMRLMFHTRTDKDDMFQSGFETEEKPKKKMSNAMKIYLARAEEHEAFMKKEITEFEIGKRHLANIMGQKPESFTQAHINRSIEYLFPSGLYDKQARPAMWHPKEIFPSRKAAEFDKTGRPFHFLFYTCKPNYYETLYNVVDTLETLNETEDAEMAKGILPSPDSKLVTDSSRWISKMEMEKMYLEPITDLEYEQFLAAMNRLIEHPLSKSVANFIMKYRRKYMVLTHDIKLPPLQKDSNGRPFITVKNCMRKSARGQVTVWGNGSGSITINGQDIKYFTDIQCREQIIFPLIFSNMADKVDIEATVTGGGPTGQSGAIRWGIAWGLRNFVDTAMIEKMRIAGLLTRDWRIRERKKWGQEGARRKFTWKKR